MRIAFFTFYGAAHPLYYSPLLLIKIYPDKIDEHIVHHDERDKPASAEEDYLIDILVYAPKRAKQYRDGKHCGIDAVNAPFVPIWKALNTVIERLQEQGEPRTEEKQCITDYAPRGQCSVTAIEGLHVRVGDQNDRQQLQDVDSHIPLFHILVR